MLTFELLETGRGFVYRAVEDGEVVFTTSAHYDHKQGLEELAKWRGTKKQHKRQKGAVECDTQPDS